MNCNCNDKIPINFPSCNENMKLDYCGVEIPVSNVIFVDVLPEIGDSDQLYVVGTSIYRWDNDLLQYQTITSNELTIKLIKNFLDNNFSFYLEQFFTSAEYEVIFDGGNADVTLAVLDTTILE